MNKHDERISKRAAEETSLSLFHEIADIGGALLKALRDIDSNDPYCMGFIRGFEAGLGIGMDTVLADVNRVDQDREHR
jgi:hypothetical protein